MLRFIDYISRNKIYVISVVLAVIVFWAHYPWYSFDSCWYIGYIDYFTQEAPLNEWNAVRGWGYPLLLYVAHLIKPGYMGLQIVLSCIYALYCIYVLRLYRLIKRHYNQNYKTVEIVLINLVMFYSPMIWGYAHLVLTEFTAVSVFFIYSFVCVSELDKAKSNIKRIIVFSLKSLIIFIFAWFLKQSYAIFILTMFCIVSLHSLIIHKCVKIRIVIICSLAFVVIGWYSSIAIWNRMITEHNEDTVLESNSGVGNIALVEGVSTNIVLRYFYPTNIDGQSTVNAVDSKGDVTQYKGRSSYTDLTWAIDCIKYAPQRFIQGIIDDYGVIAGIYGTGWNADGSICISSGLVEKNQAINIWRGLVNSSSEENYGLIYYHLSENRDYYMEMDYRIELLKSINSPTDKLYSYSYMAKPNFIMMLMKSKKLWDIDMVMFSITILSMPFMLFMCMVKLYKNKYLLDYLVILIPGILYLFAHIYIGAVINRYAVPIFIITKFCIFVMLLSSIEKTKMMNSVRNGEYG